ncbi:MAG: undecaprenyl-diphosphate phosphatase [Alphaproteobacteria bacterium]
MTEIQVFVFAIVQAVTELFPVSSVAHGVLTPYLFGWNLDPEFLKLHFLPFIVMLHLGTASALLAFFWRDWLNILVGLFDKQNKVARRTFVLIVVATIPAAVIGFLAEKALRGIFSSVTVAAAFLIANGFILFVGERLRGSGTREIEDLSLGEAVAIGLSQSIALVPGFSRSGASMVAGFWVGLRHEAAAHFSMLLATPIIAGAGVLEIPKLVHEADAQVLHSALIGGAAAAVFAFATVWMLMRWFRTHEVNALRPFAVYCWVLGGAVLWRIMMG